MLAKIRSLRPAVWGLLAVAVFVAVAPRVAVELGWVGSQQALYVVQPVLAAAGAFLVWHTLHGKRDRVRHKSDKILIIGSVLAVWFVVYFLSGLFVTFVHNALASSLQGTVMNVVSFGITVAAVEYMRYGLMLSAGRRNLMWFGIVVSLVFTIQQISLVRFAPTDVLLDSVKFAVGSVIPAFVGSLLLTYISTTAGYGSQLMYALGVVALTVFPPIIPKYDWYMSGMTTVLLAVATYIVLDRNQGVSDDVRTHRERRRPKVAFDIMFGFVMLALVLFMTGVFSYKPVVIMSNSMLPIFARGSVVVVQRVDNPMDIQMGDIIQYVAENKIITHRVVAIDTAEDDSGDRVFTTKGDNNPSNDRPVKQSQVIGTVRSTVPFVGYPTVWLQELAQKH